MPLSTQSTKNPCTLTDAQREGLERREQSAQSVDACDALLDVAGTPTMKYKHALLGGRGDQHVRKFMQPLFAISQGQAQ